MTSFAYSPLPLSPGYKKLGHWHNVAAYCGMQIGTTPPHIPAGNLEIDRANRLEWELRECGAAMDGAVTSSEAESENRKRDFVDELLLRYRGSQHPATSTYPTALTL
ncbi:MAG: hypothetical protein ACYDBH_15200 [Acidobacteriaceae bacterium]